MKDNVPRKIEVSKAVGDRILSILERPPKRPSKKLMELAQQYKETVKLMTVDQVLDAWQVSEHQRALLLDQPDAKPQIITIHDALCRIFDFSAEHADAWVSKPNRAFEGRTPLDLMLTGEIEQVRRYVIHHLYNA